MSHPECPRYRRSNAGLAQRLPSALNMTHVIRTLVRALAEQPAIPNAGPNLSPGLRGHVQSFAGVRRRIRQGSQPNRQI